MYKVGGRIVCASDWIGLLESPSAFQHEWIDHTDRHHSLKPFEGVKNHGAMAPGTRRSYMKMVAPCFGWKRRAAIGGDKGAEGGSGPHKGAALTVAFVAIRPLAVNKSSHRHALHELWSKNLWLLFTVL